MVEGLAQSNAAQISAKRIKEPGNFALRALISEIKVKEQVDIVRVGTIRIIDQPFKCAMQNSRKKFPEKDHNMPICARFARASISFQVEDQFPYLVW